MSDISRTCVHLTEMSIPTWQPGYCRRSATSVEQSRFLLFSPYAREAFFHRGPDLLLLGRRAILRYPGQGVTGMSLVGNGILPFPGQRERFLAQFLAVLRAEVLTHGEHSQRRRRNGQPEWAASPGGPPSRSFDHHQGSERGAVSLRPTTHGTPAHSETNSTNAAPAAMMPAAVPATTSKISSTTPTIAAPSRTRPTIARRCETVTTSSRACWRNSVRCRLTGAMRNPVAATDRATVIRYTVRSYPPSCSNRAWNGKVNRNPVSNCTPVCTTRSSCSRSAQFRSRRCIGVSSRTCLFQRSSRSSLSSAAST